LGISKLVPIAAHERTSPTHRDDCCICLFLFAIEHAELAYASKLTFAVPQKPECASQEIELIGDFEQRRNASGRWQTYIGVYPRFYFNPPLCGPQYLAPSQDAQEAIRARPYAGWLGNLIHCGVIESARARVVFVVGI
jgi:hypothetical protein